MASMSSVDNGRQKVHDPIAVIGMSCRLPGNNNSPQALWNFLERGGCAETSVPESRFSLDGHFDGSRRFNTLKSPGAMFLENIDLAHFDAQFFSISKQEAVAMDPQQRQLLEVVYECLENAGVSLQALSGQPVGCFVASSTSDYRDIHARDPEDRPPNATVGLVPAILSNRISHFLNIKGPSMTIDTACSASLVSLDVANKYIQTGEIRAAIVAGVHLWLSPEANMDSGAMREAFSTSGKCHTFDAKADGYIKAEGVNALLLKRLDDAIRDRDPIRAIIRGSSTNSDGRTPGIANPSVEAQTAAIRTAYANAGITDLSATSYLECHGTGTQAGDPIEVQAASSALRGTRDKEPLRIGSIKSNVGHSECSAGVSGMIKTVLALEKSVIPGNPTFVTPSPKIDFENLKVRANRSPSHWPSVALRRASVNSFGFGGSNAHAVLEEATPWARPTYASSFRNIDDSEDFFADDEPIQSNPTVLVFSANDKPSLMSYVENLKKHLASPTVKVDLADLAYTLSERRSHHFYRGFMVTNKSTINSGALVCDKKGIEKPRIGFVFTGQGAQWPQMGKLLIEAFPLATELICRMDSILQASLAPPSWSLLRELTEPRATETLRRPVFSQPLVTALQIVIIEILKTWGVSPEAVVGHSSGEIAAAYCVGHLSMEDAIKVAFYRGQASERTQGQSERDEGMLAVGLGSGDVMRYLEDLTPPVEIACYNSPKSVTLSGKTNALTSLRARLEGDGHFARILHVDHAYHSKYMIGVSTVYKRVLDHDVAFKSFSSSDTALFSSVLGRKLDQSMDSAYWQTNMTSPVYFENAIREMVKGPKGATMLIEIGPSGTLGGPISEIKTTLPIHNSPVQYFTAFQRGQEDLRSLYSLAGQLFIADALVDLKVVNQRHEQEPRVIVDLPNYSWNHSSRYWYESEASKNWRFRLFPPHDLIGSKILGSSWDSPVWKKDLSLQEVPWLKDHKLGSDIVVPGAAMVVMAVEAMNQLVQAQHKLENKYIPKRRCFRLRNATFSRALVLEEGRRQTVMTVLRARTGSKDSWFEFKIQSLVESNWLEHSRGLIRVQEDRLLSAPEGLLKPLTNGTPGELWYQAMENVGYALGPAFQKHLEAESLSGVRSSRSTLNLEDPPSSVPQSRYQMHPTSVDAILQVCAPALWNGNRTNINAVIIPSIIDDLIISSQPSSTSRGMAVVTSAYTGLGDVNEVKNYTADVNVYDVETGLLLFQLSKLRTSTLNTRAVEHIDPTYCSLNWMPDVSFLSEKGFEKVIYQETNVEQNYSAVLNRVLDLIAFKKPNLKVAEIVAIQDDSTSLWLDTFPGYMACRLACDSFHFIHTEAKTLITAQNYYKAHTNAGFSIHDISKSTQNESPLESKVDLVIARLQSSSNDNLQTILKSLGQIVVEGGQMLLIQQHCEDDSFRFALTSNSEAQRTLDENGFRNVRTLCRPTTSSPASTLIAEKTPSRDNPSGKRLIHLLHFSPIQSAGQKILDSLKKLGWTVSIETYPFAQTKYQGIILVLDDLDTPFLSTVRQLQWASLQDLCNSDNKILWLSVGSQFEVSRPQNAPIHGLMRTIHDEDPSINLTTLDVEDPSGENTVAACHTVLEFLQNSSFQKTGDYEFVERRGIIYVSRILPDSPINEFVKAEEDGSPLLKRCFHDTDSLIRLDCERIGNLDSLQFHEINPKHTQLQYGEVEIKVAASGLNFKDIAISTGLIPGNERLLGFEGAGTILRSNASMLEPGQRVLFTKAGSFANRLIAAKELVHAIPDWISFEEAATLGAVYPVALYSLFDLADVHHGQRVLIHSAAGGLGIACINLCKHVHAEIFATVGNDQKRALLVDKFDIPKSHIFNSRSAEFSDELLRATDGEGVDIIINSLTGDLLEESWNCIRDGGTMVELGKRDLLERNYLPMEPFLRNVSYRSFDISHKSVPNKTMARLLKQMFTLLENKQIKPITPRTDFSFADITAAFRFMRDGKHMGKIVISDSAKSDIEVPVRPALRSVRLREDASYLIIGGLKGLCGSMALSFARHGAKNLIVMGRSGFDDKASQTVIKNIEAERCQIQLVKGDVTIKDDVTRAFTNATAPIAGVVQGAMVVRGKLYQAMTAEDYHVAVACKIQGTWNLHNVALEQNITLDFFSLLSSTSGVAGQSGQANYVAANAFLDAFAIYRRRLGLRANSIALGPLWDVGYMSRNKGSLPKTNTSTFHTITEGLFHKILEYSILQQTDPINEASASHLITGMAIPLSESSTLRSDARFSGLFGSSNSRNALGTTGGSKEMQAFNLLFSSKADPTQTLAALVEVSGQRLATILQLNDAIEPTKPLGSYGMESLAAVEMRNWVRMELQADVTMLEILNATSLVALCEKILTKMQPST